MLYGGRTESAPRTALTAGGQSQRKEVPMTAKHSSEAGLIGRAVHFTGNWPNGTPDQFEGVVIDETECGREVEVEVDGFNPTWLPRMQVAEVK